METYAISFVCDTKKMHKILENPGNLLIGFVPIKDDPVLVDQYYNLITHELFECIGSNKEKVLLCRDQPDGMSSLDIVTREKLRNNYIPMYRGSDDTAAPEKKDNVNHPKHYANSCSLECIDVMMTVLGPDAVYGGCLMNAFKYLWRYKNKGKPEEDLAKAKWYLDKATEINLNPEIKDNWYIDEELLTKVSILYNTTVGDNGEE